MKRELAMLVATAALIASPAIANLRGVSGGGGGSTSPGGTSGEIQYNNSGSFAGAGVAYSLSGAVAKLASESGSGNALQLSGDTTLNLGAVGGFQYQITAAGTFVAVADNAWNLGNPTSGRFANIYAATAFGAGGSTGVSCSGTPTSSFASVGGIVTHC